MTDTVDARRTTPRHPIALVTERTGLSQDLLRVWERRYRAVVPTRGPGGQRLYSDADIERLSLLHAATRAGRSISRVASLADEALAELVEEDLAARERRARSRTAPARSATWSARRSSSRELSTPPRSATRSGAPRR